MYVACVYCVLLMQFKVDLTWCHIFVSAPLYLASLKLSKSTAICYTVTGGCRIFNLGEATGQEVWGRKSPSGVQVQGRSPLEAEAVRRHCLLYRFWLQRRSKCENFAQFTPLIDQSVSRWRAKRQFAGGAKLSLPSSCLATPLYTMISVTEIRRSITLVRHSYRFELSRHECRRNFVVFPVALPLAHGDAVLRLWAQTYEGIAYQVH